MERHVAKSMAGAARKASVCRQSVSAWQSSPEALLNRAAGPLTLASTIANLSTSQPTPAMARPTISSQSQPEPSLAHLRVIHPPSHLASHFWPAELRQHYLTLQSLFLELSDVPTTVSSEILGRIRYGWWRDAISACYSKESRRFKHPIVVALEQLIWDENVRRRGGLVHNHFEAIVDAWVSADP